MAAQTLADEKYGEDGGDLADDDPTKEAVLKLADVKGTVVTFTVTGGKVETLEYTEESGAKTCTYTESTGEYTFD